MKRLIFDIDNTLILWKSEYREAMKKTIEHFNLDLDYEVLDDLIEVYENYYDKYQVGNITELFNKNLNLNLTNEFTEYWLKELGNMADDDLDIKPLLDYLKEKYELVILTNWFNESQTNRLKKIDIYKYFSNLYSGEDVIKPNKEAYLKAIGDKDIKDCIMIGDNLKVDIEGAINIGLKAILVDIKDIYPDSDKYIRIKNIHELKEML